MKQHFLPQSYLREFCNLDKKLHTIEIAPLQFGQKVFVKQKTTAEVCWSKDFYTIDKEYGKDFRHLNGLDALYLEKKFQEYEKMYPGILMKLKRRESILKASDAELLLYAIIDIKIRNPYFRNSAISTKIESVIDNLFDKYVDEIHALNLIEDYQLKNKQIMLDEMITIKHRIMTDKNYPQKVHISSLTLRKMESQSIHNKIINHLMNFEWILLESTNQFITTDNPGVCIDSTNIPQNTKFEGEVFFFMPLTPKLCLGISTTTPDIKFNKLKKNKNLIYAPAPTQIIDYINEMHGYHLSNFIFSNNKQVINNIADKINKNKGFN